MFNDPRENGGDSQWRTIVGRRAGGILEGEGMQRLDSNTDPARKDGSVNKKERLFAAFIDFCKAYDSVNRNKLWRCLEDLGLQG